MLRSKFKPLWQCYRLHLAILHNEKLWWQKPLADLAVDNQSAKNFYFTFNFFCICKFTYVFSAKHVLGRVVASACSRTFKCSWAQVWVLACRFTSKVSDSNSRVGRCIWTVPYVLVILTFSSCVLTYYVSLTFT